MTQKQKKCIIFGLLGFFFFIVLVIFNGHSIGLPKTELPQKTERNLVYLSSSSIDIFNLSPDEFSSISSGKQDETIYRKSDVQKEVLYQNHRIFSLQLSPLKNRVGIFYYTDDSYNNLEMKFFDVNKNVYKEIYHSDFEPWNLGSGIQWLGNDHIFFTVHCGTDCEGLILRNVVTGETHSATLSDSSWQGIKRKPYIIFPDWFSKKEFKLNGFLDEISGEIKDDQTYLVFKMVDDNDRSLGEIKFLFTGNSLIKS